MRSAIRKSLALSIILASTMASKNPNWYRDHIRSFVVPSLLLTESNSEYTVTDTDYSSVTHIDGMEYKPDLEAEAIVKMEIEQHKPLLTDRDYRLILDILNALENRSKGKAIILPGRDVWPFFVLMQKRKVFADRIHHFPWMSRNAITNPSMVFRKMALEGIEKDYLLNNCFLFDTGFAGSIFRGIAKAYLLSEDESRELLNHSGMASSNSYLGQMCILQKNQYRSQVLMIEEGVPKYFHSGDKTGRMTLASRDSIMNTARYTYDLWNGITIKEQYKERKKGKKKKNSSAIHWCSLCKKYHGD